MDSQIFLFYMVMHNISHEEKLKLKLLKKKKKDYQLWLEEMNLLEANI